jgi:hypothetical protein
MLALRGVMVFALVLLLGMEILATATHFDSTISKPSTWSWSSLASDHPEPHEDGRCKCRCPSLSALAFANASLNLHPDRQVYVRSSGEGASAARCSCADVVVPEIANATKSAAKGHLLVDIDDVQSDPSRQLTDIFCPRCVCVYETRNTSAIKVAVILVLCLKAVLVMYMFFLPCLKPWMAVRGRYPKLQTPTKEARI